MVLYFGVALLIFSALFMAAAWVVLRRSDRIDMASKFRSDFLDCAHSLIKDDRVPADVVRFSAFLVQHLFSKSMLREFTVQLLFSRPTKPSAFLRQVEAMPPELQSLFVKTVVLYGVSVTYNNFILGFFFRRLFWVLANSTAPKTSLADNRVRTLADDLAEQACAA